MKEYKKIKKTKFSTCNIVAAASKRNQTSKKWLRALMGRVSWLSSWSAFRRHIKML